MKTRYLYFWDATCSSGHITWPQPDNPHQLNALWPSFPAATLDTANANCVVSASWQHCNMELSTQNSQCTIQSLTEYNTVCHITDMVFVDVRRWSYVLYCVALPYQQWKSTCTAVFLPIQSLIILVGGGFLFLWIHTLRFNCEAMETSQKLS